jgi:NADH-quinone oxidoreductase subunit G
MDAGRMLAGGLDALLLLGLEPEADSAAGVAALEVLGRTGFIACLTPYVTEQMKGYASVLLPVGTAYETSGTFVNCEGHRQVFNGAARPVGEARPAWKVLRVLANQLGLEGFDYQSSEEIRAEFDAQLAATGPVTPSEAPRNIALEHAGAMHEPGMYATDMLLRRSQPLQETAAGREGGRQWQ